MISDYLATGAAIFAYLPDLLTGAGLGHVRVLSDADVASVEESAAPAPSVHVVYLGESEINAAGAGRIESVTQLWGVVIVVPALRGSGGVEALTGAGPILATVLRGLMGWSPGGGWSTLSHTKSPFRTTYRNGRLYYPLMMSTTAQITSSLGARHAS